MEFTSEDKLPEGIRLRDLQREAYQLNNIYPGIHGYPALLALALSFESQRDKMGLSDLAELIGKDNKIAFIKAIRERYKDSKGQYMGLYEAKTLAEGVYRNKGWM